MLEPLTIPEISWYFCICYRMLTGYLVGISFGFPSQPSPVKGINIQVVGEGVRINIEGPFTIIHSDGYVEEIPLSGSLSMDEEPNDILPRWRLDLEWVDLQFEALPNNSILELLRKYLIGVRMIVEEFEEALEGPRARPRIEAPTHVVYLNLGDTPNEAFLGAGGSRLPAVEPEFRMLFVNSGSEHAQEVSLISGYQHTVIHPDPSAGYIRSLWQR